MTTRNFACCLLILAALAAAAPLSAASGTAPSAADPRSAQVDALLEPWTKPGSPGAAVAVIEDGQMVHARGYGLANLELDVPITPQSVFYLGSVSKQFVAAAVVLLAQQGKLSLDDDVRQHVPELPDYGAPITLRHLIHHTSGLRDYLALMDLAGIELGRFHRDQPIVELLARQQGLNFPPGERHLYSNSGYFLLNVVVQRASGKPLREFAQEHIFGPLGMAHSHFHDDYSHLIPNRASAYFPGPDGGYRAFLTTFDRVGSGGVFSTVEDLYLWDQNFYHPKVGGNRLIETLHTRGRLADGQEIPYAFGLVVGEHRGERMVEHGGSLGGYNSYLVRFPDRRLSVVVLANLSAVPVGRLAMGIADLYLGQRPAAEPKPEARQEPSTIPVAAADLARLAGHYWEAESQLARRILVRDGELIYQRGPDSESRLAPVAPGRFVMRDVPVAVAVSFPEPRAGEVRKMLVQVAGEDPSVFEAYDPFTPSAAQLAAYAGSYHSAELAADHELIVRGERLVARGPDGGEVPLAPVLVDLFSVAGPGPGVTLRFERDGGGAVRGFTLDAGRVLGLRFERR